MKKALLFFTVGLLLTTTLLAQSEVSGTVTRAEDNTPVEGATVIVNGTTIGMLTNAEGRYQLRVPKGTESLTFSFVGMRKMVVPISGRTEINVSLEEDVMELDEVVVTALGISREKRGLGYAVQDVDGNELRSSGEVNVIQSLASKAAGVQVIGSGGTPGASSKILIRGNATFTGNNQPLMVVDGVPIDNATESTIGRDFPFNANLSGVNNSNRGIDINPDDIETITVLKGPAAAALYGVRAGSGAIVITTKRGNSGKKGMSVDFRTSLEFNQVNKLPELQSTYAQGNGGGGIDANGNPTVGVYDVADPGPDFTFFTGDDVSFGTSASWGPKISDVPGVEAYDNMNTFFQTGVGSVNNLAISGGNEMSNFRMSVGYTNQTGVVPNTNFTRTSVRLTNETKLNDRLTIFGTANYINSGGRKAQNGSNLSGVMLTLTRTPASFDLLGGGGEEGYLYPSGQQNQYFFVYDNPYFSAYQNQFTDDINRINGNVAATYKPLNWLNITYRVGTDVYTDQRKSVFAIGAWDPPAPTGQIEENLKRYQELYSDLLISAQHNFTQDLNGSITLGNNLNHRYSQNLYGRGRNLSVPDFYNLNNASDLYSDNFEQTIRTAALFFDANVAWRDVLYLNVTGRNEWASTFGEAKNNFFYPSASLSFAFTELLPKNDILSFGKIRLARAQAGVNPDPYLTRTQFVSPFFTDGFTDGNSFPYLGQAGFGFSSILGNPDLRPELVTGNELGIDLRFFLGRLNLDVTLYEQTTTDILVQRPLAGSSGFRFVFANSGSMVNRGIEAILSADIVKTKNFTWNIVGNFTRNVNEVLALADGVEEINIETAFSSIGSFAIVGQPYGALYATKWQRTEAGELIINPTTGLPLLAAERGNVGNPFPDFIAGIRNSFKFKGVQLSGLLDIRQGGDVWCGTCARLNRLGRTEASADRERTYLIEGVVQNADGTFTPNTTEASAISYYQGFVGDAGAAVEQVIYDGSWLRLRELSLSYSLDLPNGFLRSADIALTGRNLWLSTDYPGVDPETSLTGAGSNVNGFDYFNMPGTKSYLVTVSLGF